MSYTETSYSVWCSLSSQVEWKMLLHVFNYLSFQKVLKLLMLSCRKTKEKKKILALPVHTASIIFNISLILMLLGQVASSVTIFNLFHSHMRKLGSFFLYDTND